MRAELTGDVRRAAETLRSGGLVAFATETVYGLGGNALNEQAVARIFEAKERPRFDPLIVHLSEPEEVHRVVRDIPAVAEKLMNRFWPGPLTLVLPKRESVPDLVTAGLPDVAVRVPDHPQARELIRLSGVPVAAPSANPFGRISPTTSAHVMEQLGEKIDLVLEGGACRIGVESTVVRVQSDGHCVLLRPGGLTREELQAEVGILTDPAEDDDEHSAQSSPGRLSKHYAPHHELRIVDDWSQADRGKSVGVLAFGPVPDPQAYGCVEVLSATEDLTEATANFFAALRRLDAAGVEVIFAQRFPDQGLGYALNDRLVRAAKR